MHTVADTRFAVQDDAPLFNVIQVVVLNAISFTGVTASAVALGYGWGVGMIAGWLGGSILTFGLLALVVTLHPFVTGWFEDRLAAAQDAMGPEQRRAAMVEDWDDDRMADYAEFVHAAWAAERSLGQRRRSGYRPAGMDDREDAARRA